MSPSELFDLSGYFNAATASAIRDAWNCERTNGNPEPIRQHYRENQHAEFRALLTHIMRGGS